MLNVKNRATSSLASGISDSDLSLTVATGEGSRFPVSNFNITIEDEILLCSSRTDDVFTVVREQEDTIASAHDTGKSVQLRITAGIIVELQDRVHNGLGSMDGGTAGEYYHLTSAQHIIATQAATTSVNGYLLTADWDTFNEKAEANQTMYIGTTALAINRTTGAIDLTGITSIDGNAGTVTNGVYTTSNVNVLADITSTGANIEDAVTKKHASGSDTTLGTIAGNIAFDTTARTIAGIANGDLVDSSTDTIASLLAPTADFSMNTHKITGVVDPTADQDAVTYGSIKSLLGIWDDTGLVLYLPFDEAIGETATDLSVEGNDGTFLSSGHPDWSIGYRNAGVDFDGVNDYIDCGHDSSLDLSLPFSLEAWVKLEGRTTDRDIIFKGVSGNLVELKYDSSDDYWELVVSDGNYRYAKFSQSNPDLSTWYHIVGTCDGDTVKIYVDNVLGSTTEAIGTLTDPSAYNLTIGCRGSFTDRFFDGKIDEVRVYNRVLTTAEIKMHYLRA